MISILLALCAPALASDAAVYAKSATVDLPPAGAVRVTLPPDLVGAQGYALDRALRVTDATGRAVPYAVITSDNDGASESSSLSFRPVSGDTWDIDAAEGPVDALALDVLDLDGLGPFRARVTWNGDAGPGAAEGLLYRVSDDESRTIALPHVRGPFRVTLTGYGGARPRLSDVQGVRNAPDHVEPNVEAVPVGEPVITEDGRARYVLHLAGLRDVEAVRLEVPESVDVLDRGVVVRAPSVGGYPTAATEGRVRRLHLGDTHVDRLEVPITDITTDTLIVEIELDRGAPLPVSQVDVVSTGAMLVLRDAGPAPHTVLGAATTLDTAYDLGVAVPELLRAPTPLVAIEAVAPNPAFVPLPTRAGVDLPGPDLGLARFAWERPIEGTGWVRLRLDRDVLARTRADVGDVRVVDAAGRQLPFLLVETGEEAPWPVGEVQRTEEGGSTLLRVPLDGTAPVGSVLLTTSQGVFERTVTVLRDAGRTTIPIRTVVWNGPARGGTLSIDLGERVGDTLLVRIDNGDDAPLPIDAVKVGSPVWEIRTNVPEGGARLVYGAPGVRAPDYDLSLLTDEVRAMPVADATLGAERALTPPSASAVDRVATLAGVGLLAVGLLGMVARVLRGVPPSEPTAPSAPSAPSTPT